MIADYCDFSLARQQPHESSPKVTTTLSSVVPMKVANKNTKCPRADYKYHREERG